ncbi:hypothetical protein [Erwinia sp. S38]|uniref:hypothetical protein n=1 Tax=Erwinia sp. S38 TaxID=2769338 RepID=UPI00190E0765|nr:hypothetical protein [Erwinia sp. S38]MBK0002117.1 hypothetical protein [Erwinia sp. S38]
MTEQQTLFLCWFFHGNFFSTLKTKIKKEIRSGKNQFRTIFFDNNRSHVNLFIGEDIPKINNKNFTKVQENYLHQPHMAYLKDIIVGNISADASSPNNIESRLDRHGHRILKNSHDNAEAFMIKQYENFRNSKRCINYVKTLNGQVCGYCDKGILDCTDSAFYGDLDHIKDKVTHYYYAININNLVPCCKVCNQKKSQQPVIFNPTAEKLDDIFDFYIDDEDLINALFSLQTNKDISVKLREKNTSMAPKLANLNQVLALDDRYKNSGLVVTHLAQLKKVYNDDYINAVTALLGPHYSPAQIKAFLLGEFARTPNEKIQPFTKLVRDLAFQMRLFE